MPACRLGDFKRINDTYGHAVGDEFVVVAAGVRQQDAPGLLRRIEEAFTRDPVRIGDLSLHQGGWS